MILIESQWNLNEIVVAVCSLFGTHINRITVEFKYSNVWTGYHRIQILIESQWNLNVEISGDKQTCMLILIESQWNLNYPANTLCQILTSY